MIYRLTLVAAALVLGGFALARFVHDPGGKAPPLPGAPPPAAVTEVAPGSGAKPFEPAPASPGVSPGARLFPAVRPPDPSRRSLSATDARPAPTGVAESPPGATRRLGPVVPAAPAGAARRTLARPLPSAPAGDSTLAFAVMDMSHSPIPDARITIAGPSGQRSDLTSIAGEAVFDGLAAGDYTYTVEAEGRDPLESTKPVALAAAEERVLTLWVAAEEMSIAGRVMDQYGEPVEGADVVASRFTGRVEGELARDPEDREREGQSDSEGYYEITGLEPGRYLVRTRETEELPSVSTVAEAGAADADLSMPAARKLVIQGVVMDEYGRPVPGASVVPLRESQAYVQTDARGRYELSMWHARMNRKMLIQFSAPGYDTRKLSADTTAPGAGGRVRLDARLTHMAEASLGVTGVVASPDGAVSGARVHLYSPSARRGFHATTDPNGRFAVDVVPAEDYHVEVNTGGKYQDYRQSGLDLRRARLFLDLRLEPLDQGSVQGTVTDPAGRALPGVRLEVRSDRARDRAVQLVTDQWGRFQLEQVPAGNLSFLGGNDQITGVSVMPDHTVDVDLVLDRGDRILDGRLLDAERSGQPVVGARLQLNWNRRGGAVFSSSSRSTVTDADGRFAFHGLGPGPRRLHILTPGYEGQSLVLDGSERGIEILVTRNDSAAR